MENLDIRPLAEADADDFVRLRLRALKEHPEAFGSSYEEERIRPSGEGGRAAPPADGCS